MTYNIIRHSSIIQNAVISFRFMALRNKSIICFQKVKHGDYVDGKSKGKSNVYYIFSNNILFIH